MQSQEKVVFLIMVFYSTVYIHYTSMFYSFIFIWYNHLKLVPSVGTPPPLYFLVFGLNNNSTQIWKYNVSLALRRTS